MCVPGATDFVPVEMLLEFLPGTRSVDFSVFLLDDAVAEGNESFTVILESSDPNVMISGVAMEIRIMDDDGI